MLQAVLAWTPAVAWAGVLFLLSDRSSLGDLTWLPGWGDEVGHAVLFSVLGVTLAFGRHRTGWPPGLAGHVLLACLGVLYGVADEWHQSFVPGRDPSPLDVAADTLGVTLGYSLFMLLRRSHDESGRLPSSPDA